MKKIQKIMVVEDNMDEAKLIKMSLEMEGYEVTTTINGKEAKEKIDGVKPDLIVLDVMMPQMDGFTFCKWLRLQKRYEETPVILLTAVGEHIYDSKYPLNGVLRADSDEYLEKPVKPEVLIDTVSKLLK